jgi:hypothetical protein
MRRIFNHRGAEVFHRGYLTFTWTMSLSLSLIL